MHTLDISHSGKTLQTGHLKQGGSDPLGSRLDTNSFFLTLDNDPFFGISGEFHYARYPAEYWEEELGKIKAGGVSILATYVFWMFHEERQGEFVWSGQRDLRHFVELCARRGLKVALRVGPFAHGEWRNGGLPDWLYGQPFEVRTNDPRYLALVERLYAQVAAQVQGLFFRDGGPIIAIQLENEFMHCGAPWETIHPHTGPEWVPSGREGVAHLKQLQAIARRVGLEAPFTFITAWGGAPILEDESLPVYGEYAYPVWLQSMPASEGYVFRDRHQRPVDHPTHRVPAYYPYLTAELQGGIQITSRSRPIVPSRSTEAMAVVRIGSGANYIGYYMYHGGTNPTGDRGYSNEAVCPRLSYDFQAPLGEFGRPSGSYPALKLLHLFLHGWGKTLAPLPTILPPGSERVQPGDPDPLRFCARAADGSGFFFINNFQDHAEMHAQAGVAFYLLTPTGSLRIPLHGELTIPKDACLILPVNLDLSGTCLAYATTQPLTHLDTSDYTQYVFFVVPGVQPEYCFPTRQLAHLTGDVSAETSPELTRLHPIPGVNHSFSFIAPSGRRVVITTLTRSEAETAWLGKTFSRERLIVGPTGLEFTPDDCLVLRAEGSSPIECAIFPPLPAPVACQGGRVARRESPLATRLRVELPASAPAVQVIAAGPRKRLVEIPPSAWEDASDLFLTIDYEGDAAMAFIDGVMVADNFNNGLPWVIGLKRFRAQLERSGLCLVFQPLRQGEIKNVSSSVAARFAFEGQELLSIRDIHLTVEHSIAVSNA